MRIIGQVAGHEKNLEIEDVLDKIKIPGTAKQLPGGRKMEYEKRHLLEEKQTTFFLCMKVNVP